MQEQTYIVLSAKCLEAIRNSTNAGSVLYDELAHHMNGIVDLLTGYHFRSRGSVLSPEIDETSVSIDSEGKGSFKVKYILGMYNACADIDLSDKAEMWIDLNIDMETGNTALTGEYIPEREPDEF